MQLTIKWVDKLNKLVGVIVGVMLAIMAILIIVQIFFRFVISYPLHWSEELSRYLMIYSIFFGVPLVLRQQKLIAIEFISELLNESKRRILKMILMLISIVFFAILFIQGLEILQTVKMQTSAGLRIPMSIPYAAIPIGAVLMIINAIAVIFELMMGKKKEEE